MAAESLRRLVAFEQVNLVAQLPPNEPFDVVFFRNVSMYWKQETVERVWLQLGQLTHPGSVVFVGPSDPFPENLQGWVHKIQRNARCFWRTSTQAGTQHRSAASSRKNTRAVAPAVPPVKPGRAARPEPAATERLPRQAQATIETPPAVNDAPVAATEQSPMARPEVAGADDVILDQVREHADLGQYERALELLATVSPATAVPVESKLWQGILQLNLNRPKEAVTMFRQCVFLHPNEVEFRNWLAVAYEAAGRTRDAERERQNAAQLGGS